MLDNVGEVDSGIVTYSLFPGSFPFENSIWPDGRGNPCMDQDAYQNCCSFLRKSLRSPCGSVLCFWKQGESGVWNMVVWLLTSASVLGRAIRGGMCGCGGGECERLSPKLEQDKR